MSAAGGFSIVRQLYHAIRYSLFANARNVDQSVTIMEMSHSRFLSGTFVSDASTVVQKLSFLHLSLRLGLPRLPAG